MQKTFFEISSPAADNLEIMAGCFVVTRDLFLYNDYLRDRMITGGGFSSGTVA